MFLDEGLAHHGVSSHFLGFDKLVEFLPVECGHSLFVVVEILDREADGGVHLLTAAYMVLEVVGIFAYEIVLERPAAFGAVPGGALRGKLGHQFVLLDSLYGQAVCRIVPAAEGLHEHEFPGSGLVMDIPRSERVHTLDVPHLERYPFGIGLGDDP